MKQKTVFACTECGYEAPKWLGRCPGCGNWNTMEEFTPAVTPSSVKQGRSTLTGGSKPTPITAVDTDDEERITTGMSELDRVLGGGAVAGSFVLVGGEPGVGKSTLLLQICETFCKNAKVLYVSGEESARQLKLRANRLGVNPDTLYLYAQTDIEHILSSIETLSPAVVIIDSIQTTYRNSLDSAPGSVTQIRECAQSLLRCAKEQNVTIFIVGHVNKEGSIAGPKILEHMVDCVLYFEGERHVNYRIIRAAKNRYGSTDEIGVFEMGDRGLEEVPNPSQALLSGRPIGASGSCVGCVMEGTRPILTEIQALVTPSGFSSPRRMTSGFDYNRAMLIMAVLEKRAGLLLGGCDLYLNVTGGIRVDEPASDLPAAIAIASSMRERPVDADTACFGEIGLTGELRAVSGVQQRVNEIARLGFKRCVIPSRSVYNLTVPEGFLLLPAKTVRDAIDAAMM